jgi:UDP:flavonoid glycosyltransferase YjiC (YdhE family)
LLAAFGDPGHAFPMIALGSALAARGHDITLETWIRWKDHVEAAGMRFAPAPVFPVFPTQERPLKPYEAVLRSVGVSRQLVVDTRPALVVTDILTLAPALAAELEQVPAGTLIPHVHPHSMRGSPPYSLGARLPHTAFGRHLWGLLEAPLSVGLRHGRDELNETRRRLGLGPVTRLHGGLSTQLCLVGTFPQLEYPRQWPHGTEPVGPLLWEPPTAEVELPPGDDPLVVVAPSTAQDPEHKLLRAALSGLAGEQVRVLATWNRRLPLDPLPVPANARLVDWFSYARTMPHARVVICHGGHGTMVRALACGAPVVVAPAAGDQNENAARADWAGVGVRLPWRFTTPLGVRLAVRRALGDDSIREHAAELGRWAADNDGAERAADLVEGFAARLHEGGRS